MKSFKFKLIIITLLVATGFAVYHFGDTTKLLDNSLKSLENTPLQGIAQQVQNIESKITKDNNLNK